MNRFHVIQAGQDKGVKLFFSEMVHISHHAKVTFRTVVLAVLTRDGSDWVTFAWAYGCLMIRPLETREPDSVAKQPGRGSRKRRPRMGPLTTESMHTPATEMLP